MLDKEAWFSEMIIIKRGKSVEELLYDESINWEDDPEEDPTTHFEFHTEIQHLQSDKTPSGPAEAGPTVFLVL